MKRYLGNSKYVVCETDVDGTTLYLIQSGGDEPVWSPIVPGELMKKYIADGKVSYSQYLELYQNVEAQLANCPICSQPGSNGFLPECFHFFHRSCLKSWYEIRTNNKVNKNCPVCREETQHRTGFRLIYSNQD